MQQGLGVDAPELLHGGTDVGETVAGGWVLLEGEQGAGHHGAQGFQPLLQFQALPHHPLGLFRLGDVAGDAQYADQPAGGVVHGGGCRLEQAAVAAPGEA